MSEAQTPPSFQHLQPNRKPRSNRKHNNSKLGCLQCKARKVKCDEEKPRCHSCARRGASCAYPNNALNPNALDQLANVAASSPHHSVGPYRNDIPTQRESHHTYEQNADLHYSVLLPPVATPTKAPLPSLHLNMAHLELFHHYTTNAASAITIGGISQQLWCQTIPHLALSHEFLMQSILAVSALHLAYLHHAQRSSYFQRASLHEDRALQLAQPEMASPNKNNADALFAFTMPTVYYGFAATLPSHTPSQDAPLQAAVQCINLLRGIGGIDPVVRALVQKGPLAPLLHISDVVTSQRSKPTFSDPTTESHFSRLLVFCSTTSSTSGTNEFQDVEMFSAAASSLRVSFLKAESTPLGDPNTPPIWTWSVRLPAAFTERLAEGGVVPLVLVAHWCVLLAKIRHYWWIQEWVDRTMEEITRVFPRGEYEGWLKWPVDNIRNIRAAEGGRVVNNDASACTGEGPLET